MNNFLHSKSGKVLISILWGFGLACLFRRVCRGRNCIIYHAPDPVDIKNKTYKYNKKCYNYYPETIKCTKSPLSPKYY